MGERPGTPQGYLGVTRRPSRREWRGAITLFVVGCGGLLLMLLFVRPQPRLLTAGSAAPSIPLDAAGGGRVDVAGAAAGRPYVVEFFEAGCAHCQEVVPRLCGEPVDVFAVDVAKDSAATITTFRRQYAPRCAGPMLLDPSLTVAAAYAVNVVPTVYLVDGGRIAYAGVGLEGVDGLGAEVRRVVGG